MLHITVEKTKKLKKEKMVNGSYKKQSRGKGKDILRFSVLNAVV